MKRAYWLLFLCALVLRAGERKLLTFEQVYLNRGEALLQPLPDIGGWIDEGHFRETRGGKVLSVHARSGRTRVLLDPGALRGKGPEGLDWLRPADASPDYSRRAYLHGDDVYASAPGAGALRRLTATAAPEKNPTLSPDGRWVAFTADGDLYACGVVSGAPARLTADGGGEVLNGYASWVYYEEILGRASRYRAFEWSPDSSRIAFLRFDESRVPRFPLFDAGGAYGRLEWQRYPKPGFPNPAVTIGIVAVPGGETDWISFPDSGDHYLTFLGWSPRGERAYVQWLNRGQDHLRVYEYDLSARTPRLVYEERQAAWVDFLEKDGFFPLRDGGFLLLTSRSGWNHLLRVGGDGRETALTGGDWSIGRIEAVDEKTGRVLFSADREDSTRSDLYSVALDGSGLRRLTRGAATHRVTPSPAGSLFLDRFSTLARPPEMRLCGRDGAVLRRLGESAAPALARYALGKTELFQIPAGDGLRLPASWILPPGFDPGSKYPVVLSVYGGPGGRTVNDAFPRRLDDHFLAQQGIIVLAVDHRGSGHFGKRGTEAMHRCLGKWEMADYGSAVAWLRTRPFVDGDRIGITGGSYGGYVAALALAAQPDLFSCGIAEYSVIDWTLYDSVYTERYMGLPAENPEGYRQASVLSHLASYRGGLRLVHGSMDDNVHMQNVLQLLDALLDLGRTAELMIYPGERHGIRGKKAAENARSAIDFWRRHLLSPEAGPTPGENAP